MLVVQPDDITFSTGNKTQNGGRWRYQYTVSWKVRNTLLKSMICTLVCWKVQISKQTAINKKVLLYTE